MRIFGLAPAALAAMTGEGKRTTGPSADPFFMVNTRDGFAADAATFTGALRAIRRLPSNARESAAVYDENGYCLYR